MAPSSDQFPPTSRSIGDASSSQYRRTGYIYALSSALASAAATVVGKWNLASISPFLMNSLIFTVASIALVAAAIPIHGIVALRAIPRPGWKWLWLFALTSMFSVLAFWSGVQLMDPSLAAFLNRAEVPVAIILGVIFLKERFTWWETVGALVSIAGIVVMRLNLRVEYSLGFWLVLGGALLFGFAEFCSKHALKYIPPLLLTAVRNVLMCVMYWIIFAAVSRNWDGLDQVWYGVIALGLLGPLLTRLLYLAGLKRMALSKAAVISQTQPVFVLLIALLAFGQLPTFRELIGGIMITFGCLLMVLRRLNEALFGGAAPSQT